MKRHCYGHILYKLTHTRSQSSREDQATNFIWDLLSSASFNPIFAPLISSFKLPPPPPTHPCLSFPQWALNLWGTMDTHTHIPSTSTHSHIHFSSPPSVIINCPVHLQQSRHKLISSSLRLPELSVKANGRTAHYDKANTRHTCDDKDWPRCHRISRITACFFLMETWDGAW